jgi:hypothetical protein
MTQHLRTGSSEALRNRFAAASAGTGHENGFAVNRG